MKRLLIISIIFTGAVLCLYNSSCSHKTDVQNNDELVSYNFQVRPIFSDKCFKCHGPDANKREAGLRFDIPEEAYKALKEHPRAHAIVPGKPDLSEMFVRISSTDTAIMMPPPQSNLPA